MKLEEAFLFIDDYTVYLASNQENYSQQHYEDRDAVLPPVSFIVSFKGARFASIGQVVDQVDAAADDKETCEPQYAGVSAEDNLLIRFGTDVNILCCWDHNALTYVMILMVTFDD